MAQDGAAGSRIFISYRREDAIAHVNALFTPLRNRFGEERVFKDTDNIAPGQDFTKVIQSQLKTCSVLLAVIGKHWVSAKKGNSDIRRIDDPHDYLRVEIVTALKNDSVLVIPILVGDATMPAAEELPEELVPLSYRNCFELRDSRWESDVTLLIRSIEKACGEPADAMPQPASRRPEPRPAAGGKPPGHERGGLDRLAARRTHQIAEHVNAARQALEALNYEDALEACGKALWLDPQDEDARDLQERAQGALDEQKIQGWLGEARQLLSGEQVNDAQLTAASGLIDEAIAVNPVHETATALRREVLGLRRQRELDRDDERHVHAVLARARENLELEEFDACIAGCDDALTVSSGSAEAMELRQRALAARDERRRNREIRQRAEKAVRETRAPIPDHVEASPQLAADGRRSSRIPVIAAAAVVVLLAGVGAWALLGRRSDTGQSSQTVVSLRPSSSAPTPAPQTGGPAPATDSATAPASPANSPPPAASAPPSTADLTPPTPVASNPASTVPPVDSAPAAKAKSKRVVDAAPIRAGSGPGTRGLGTSGPTASKPTGQPRQADAGAAERDDRRGDAVSKEVSAAEPTIAAASPKEIAAPPAPAAKPSVEKQTDEAPAVKPPAREITREGSTTRVAELNEFKEPTRLKYVELVYPKAALDARVQGAVVLQATVGEDGKVRNIKVIKSIPLLDQAAIDALSQWVYAPATRNGVAVAVEITVTISFSM